MKTSALLLVLLLTLSTSAYSQQDNMDQYSRASDWFYENLIDEKATSQEREFASKTLRFAVTGLQDDYRQIESEISGHYNRAMEFGRSKLRFLLTKKYTKRAQLYYQIYKNGTGANKDAREQVDVLLKAIFYDSNNWLYWACISTRFAHPDYKKVHDPEKGLLYGKIAVSLNPRDPWAYKGLIDSLYYLKRYEASEKVASKCLEFSKFEDAFYSNYKGDLGRAEISYRKGKAIEAQGNKEKALEYYRTAVELDKKHYWANEKIKELES